MPYSKVHGDPNLQARLPLFQVPIFGPAHSVLYLLPTLLLGPFLKPFLRCLLKRFLAPAKRFAFYLCNVSPEALKRPTCTDGRAGQSRPQPCRASHQGEARSRSPPP